MKRNTRCPVMLLIYLLLSQISHLINCFSSNLNQILKVHNVSFLPENLTSIVEGGVKDVNISFSLEYLSNPRNYTNMLDDLDARSFSICYEVDDPLIAWVTTNNQSLKNFSAFPYTNENSGMAVGQKQFHFINSAFSVKGIFLGKTHVTATIRQGVRRDGQVIGGRKLDTWVVRKNHRMQHVFVGTLSILLMVANVLMGAQLNLQTVAEVLRRPLAPALGFTCQYLLMPLISFALASVIFVPVGMQTLALGMFTTGCSPGGGASNGYTVLMDGNVDLSITMTFLSTLAALVVMPFWMFMLGRHFLSSSTADGHQHISIPYANICYSLIAMIVPLLIGVVIRNYRNTFAARANRILRPFLLLIIAFICTFGVYANFYMFRLMTWRVLFAGMCLPILGFTFGTVVAWLSRQPLSNIKAIAIETGIQNTGIGIVLLQLSFGQPDADMAAVVPVVVAMFTPPPLLIALAVHYMLRCRDERRKCCEMALEASGLGLEAASAGGCSALTLHQTDSAKPLYALDQASLA